MDTFGKAASTSLLAGAMVLSLIGCTEKPDGKFETYGHLKKSAGSTSAGSEQKPTDEPADARPPQLSSHAASFTEQQGIAKVAKPDSATAPQSTAAGATNSPSSTKVTDAAFQATSAARGVKSGAIPVSATTPARKIQLLVPDKKFKTEGPEGAWRLSYDDIDLLKILNMDPVPPDADKKMPAWLKGLEGKRVRIRGFMYPPFSQTGIHAFGLARDNQICCFGRDPKIYDVFDVQMRDGVTTDYLPNRPFDVVGVFHIRPEVEDGKLFHLYEMNDATVITK
jgi:hypothetical protein